MNMRPKNIQQLPALKALQMLPVAAREALAVALAELSVQARVHAEMCWTTDAAQALYWRTHAVATKHLEQAVLKDIALAQVTEQPRAADDPAQARLSLAALLDRPAVATLGELLPRRALTVLENQGSPTVRELCKLTPTQLRRARNCGHMTVLDIQRALAFHQLSLAPDEA